MNGYFWSFFITHVVNFLFSLRRLLRISRVQIDWKAPAISLTVAILSVWIANLSSNALLSAIAYILLFSMGLWITNVINFEDLTWLKGLVRTKNGGS